MANNDWQEYLFIQGAVFNNGTITSFGSTQKELSYTAVQNVMCDLSHLGLLEISGEDTVSFLQGQVTNDVKLLSGNNAHYTGYCSPKGRLLALFLAFSHNNHLHLQINHPLLAPITKRLEMYVMRAKVNISNVSDNTVRIGLCGHDIANLLAPFFAQIPQQVYALSSTENSTVIRLPGTTPRYEIICDFALAKEIWHSLKAQCKPVGKPCWDWLEIQAGIPDIYLKTQEEFVPQMVNLDLLGAINFKKGCYTGQEIVARTHYLGKVKRRTQLAHITSIAMPESGANVTDANQQAIGKIVRCAPSINNGFDVLVECRLEKLQENNIYWNDIALTIKALPYAINDSQ